MPELILGIIKIVVDLIEKALSGDKKSLEKLTNFLPENLKTEITSKAQDKLDEQKFGPREVNQ